MRAILVLIAVISSGTALSQTLPPMPPPPKEEEGQERLRQYQELLRRREALLAHIEKTKGQKARGEFPMLDDTLAPKYRPPDLGQPQHR